MKFVVDTNIVFSAILNTEGKIGDLIMNSHRVLEFHACDTLRTELKKHRLKLLDLPPLGQHLPPSPKNTRSQASPTRCALFASWHEVLPRA